ncbi:MAG: cytochrome b/b6 domain-containing protein [Porticoccaceae bacterium]
MANDRTRQVWDLPVRVFHWALVVLVTLLWLTGEFGGFDISGEYPLVGYLYLSNMDVHALLGQGVLVLVVFRILWGLFGSSTARFSGFVRGPATVFRELRALLRGDVPESLGHNPLGALMVLALLALLGFQAVSGLFAQDDLFFSGPLAATVSSDTSKTLTSLHKQSFSVLQVLILLHVVAVLYYLVRGRNLISAMFSGTKKHHGDTAQVTMAPWWRALICFGASLGGVYWVVNF